MKNQLLFYILILPLLGFSQFALQGDIIADINGMSNDRFGGNSTINATGDIIIISSVQHSSSTGKVQVYQFTNDSWTQVGSDIVGDTAGDNFGGSLAINADGSIIAVGAPQADGSGNTRGYVRVYENVAGTWMQLGSDFTGQADFDTLGSSVDLSADGTKIAIGASGVNTAKGEVRVYEFGGASWSQLGSTMSGIVDGDRFGNSVNLNADGTFLAIGIPSSDANGNPNGTNSGQVKVYNYTSNWSQIFTDSILGQNFALGTTVALNDDASVLVASVPQTNDPADGSGFVRIYKYNGTTNTYGLTATLNGENNEDRFGSSIAVSGDGDFVAVGAPFNDSSGSNSGKVYLYENTSGNTWSAISGIFNNSNSASDFTGSSVSLSNNGAIFSVGSFNAQNPTNSNGNTGIVKVFIDTSVLNIKETELNNKLVIYPNPVENYLYLKANTNIDTVIVYGLTGQIIIEKQIHALESKIDISELNEGSYFIKVKSLGKTTTRMILKKN